MDKFRSLSEAIVQYALFLANVDSMILEAMMYRFLEEKGMLEEFNRWYNERYKEFTSKVVDEYIDILRKAKEEVVNK